MDALYTVMDTKYSKYTLLQVFPAFLSRHNSYTVTDVMPSSLLLLNSFAQWILLDVYVPVYVMSNLYSQLGYSTGEGFASECPCSDLPFATCMLIHFWGI